MIIDLVYYRNLNQWSKYAVHIFVATAESEGRAEAIWQHKLVDNQSGTSLAVVGYGWMELGNWICLRCFDGGWTLDGQN
jgi:hypothetical protein